MPLLNPKTGIDFSDYIADRTLNFTGREWVFKAIQSWLANVKGDRFFLLTGEPGSGKTAIAARLAQFAQGAKTYPGFEAGFFHAVHFCSATHPTWVDPRDFVEAIALQLAQIPAYAKALVNVGEKQINIQINQNIGKAERSNITAVSIQTLDVSGLISPQELFNLIVLNPLQEIYQHGFNQPITILVDSLDEALTHSGQLAIVDLLDKLQGIPDRVRFLLTSRPQPEILEQFENDADIYNLTTGEGLIHSSKDIGLYVSKILKQQPVLQQKLSSELTTDVLITQVARNSEGNFLYVSYLLQMLLSQPVAISRSMLTELPIGLAGIYRSFLQRLVQGDKQTWRRNYAPLLGILAVAQAALTREQLAGFVQLKKPEVLEILEALRQFLDTDELLPASQRTYAIYHRSLADWLLDEDKAEGYWCDPVEQHERIIKFYEITSKSWQNLQKIDHYGLLHLARHLVEADRKEELYNLLLTSPSWMEKKFVSCSGDTSYLSDLEIALESFVDPLQPEQILTLVQIHTALRVIQQRSERYYSGSLSTALIWLGQEAEVLSYANLSPDAGRRYAILANTYKTLRQRGHTDCLLLDKVWKAAQAIGDISHCVSALGDVALELDRIGEITKVDEAFSQAIKLAEQDRTINNGQNKTRALTRLAEYLVKSSSVKHQGQAVEIYSLAYETAQQMQDFQKQSLLPSDVELAKLHDLQWRAILLCELSTSLGQMEFQERAATVLAEAQEIAEVTRLSVHNLKQRALELEYAEDHLKTITSESHLLEENQKILRDHLELIIIKNFLISDDQNYVEQSLVQAFLALRYVNEAKKISRNIDVKVTPDFLFSSVVQNIVSALINQKQFLEAQELAEQLPNSPEKIKTLGYVASALAQQEKEDSEGKKIIFGEIFDILEKDIKDSQQKNLSLFYIVQSLVDTQRFDEAEKTAHKIQDQQWREEAILSLVRSLIQLKSLAEPEQVAYIWKLIHTIQETTKKVDALAELCIAFVKIGLKAEAEKILIEIRKISQVTSDFTRIVGIHCGLAKILAQSGYLQQAEALFKHVEISIDNITNFNNQKWAIYVLAINLAQSKTFFVKAELLIAQISEPSWQEKALRELAVALLAEKRFTEAERIIDAIKNPTIQIGTWSQLAVALHEVGEIAEVNKILDLLIGTDQTTKDFKILAQTFLKVERYDDAEEIADGIQEVLPKEESLTDLAINLAWNGHFSRAEQVLEKVKTPWLRVEILKVLAVELLDEDYLQSRTLFNKAIQETEVIEEDWRCFKLLGELAITLFECGHHQDARNLIDKAKVTAKLTIDFWLNPNGQTRDSNQAEVYRWLSETLAQTGHFAEALSVIRSPEASIVYSSQELDSFLGFLVSWANYFEDIDPEFPIRILKESIRIAGWVRLDWNDIYTSVLMQTFK
jgi:hypothetical protein